jgi:hypothetical protein
VRLDVIDAVHQQHLADRGARGFGLDRRRGSLDHQCRIEVNARGVAVALARQVHHQDA